MPKKKNPMRYLESINCVENTAYLYHTICITSLLIRVPTALSAIKQVVHFNHIRRFLCQENFALMFFLCSQIIEDKCLETAIVITCLLLSHHLGIWAGVVRCDCSLWIGSILPAIISQQFIILGPRISGLGRDFIKICTISLKTGQVVDFSIRESYQLWTIFLRQIKIA